VDRKTSRFWLPAFADTENRAGVKSYEVSLENQSAIVVAEPSLSYEKVLQTIVKTGKKVNKGEADGVAQSVEVPAVA
jgi:copper chaperone